MAVAVAGTTVAEATSAASLACAVPAGTAVGDLLVANVVGTVQTAATTPPAGWTLFAAQNGFDGSSNNGTSLFYRVATSADTSAPSYTFASAGAAGRFTVLMVRLTGVDSATPFDGVAPVTSTGPAATSYVGASISPATAGALVLRAVSVNASSSAGKTIVGQAGLTSVAQADGSSGQNGRLAGIWSETVASPGATGTRTYTTSTAAQWAGIAVAVRSGTSTPAAGTLTSLRIGAPTGSSVPITVDTSSVTTGVRLKIADNSGMTGATFTGSVMPDSGGYATLTATGLTPGTHYWIQAEVDGAVDTAQTGQVTTDPGGQWSGRVAFGSCLTSGNSTGAAFENIVANSPALFLHLGDWHYDDNTSTSAAAHTASIEKQVAANTGLRTLLRSVPVAYQWSDHDSGNNDWTGGPAAWTPSYNTAYRQAMPVLEALPSGGLYHAVHRGRVKFLLTDGRSFKSPAGQADDANKTMFGFTQESWIADQLADPAYPVKVICLDVPWVYPTTAGDDKWGGYTAAAARLVNAISSAGAHVFLIHGDAHSLCADNGTSPNNRGALPVAGAAPFRNATSIKGGPYSSGTWPTAGAIGTTESQHGLLDITDTGTAITIRFSGRDTANVERVTLSTTYDLTAPKGTGSGAWTFTGAATGRRTPQASGAGGWVFTGTAAGKRAPRASAVGGWAFAGTATGRKASKGAGSGGWVFTGSATGTTKHAGTATSAWAFAGTAAGTTRRAGVAAGQWTFTAAATALVRRAGTGTGSLAYSGSATGHAPTVGAVSGTATGTWTFVGAAAGNSPAVSAAAGAAAGAWTFTGTAVGTASKTGSGAGVFTWVGAATGTAPTIPGAGGKATGHLTWTGTAQGLRHPVGHASGTLTTLGAATGTTTRTGAATGVWGFAGHVASRTRDITVVVGALRTRTLDGTLRTRTLTGRLED